MRLYFVDDDITSLSLYKAIARVIGPDIEIICEADPVKALADCLADMPDLLVVDYMMPKLNGLDFISAIRAHPVGGDIPIVMATGASDRETRHQALGRGATDFLTKPIDPAEMRVRLANLLALHRHLLRERTWNATLEDKVRLATRRVVKREHELTLRLTHAAEFRDPDTGHHILRVAYYAYLVSTQMGLSPKMCDLILRAAPLHDVGKLGVPDAILGKRGPLTSEEFQIMQNHTKIGHSILKESESDLIQMGAEIAISHHEKWDGSGYPNALKGQEIPISGRIVAIVDVFDALASDRPYKLAWTPEAARDYLIEKSGSHFDPDCVNAFLKNWDAILDAHHRLDNTSDETWSLESLSMEALSRFLDAVVAQKD